MPWKNVSSIMTIALLIPKRYVYQQLLNMPIVFDFETKRQEHADIFRGRSFMIK